MNIDFFKESLLKNKDATAVITDGRNYTFGEIFREYERAAAFLREKGVPEGSVTALLADFKPQSIALFLALIERDAVIVPISQTIKNIDGYVRLSDTNV